MAKSRFEYVRNYELPDPLTPNTFIIVRLDGKGFHKFSDAHNFAKPNDKRALDLMDTAAKTVFDEYKDVVMAFGESDEYSFLLRRATRVYNRRRSKINTSIVSLFTSAYVFNWPYFFPDVPLRYPPSFDGRVILYPGEIEIRDYFSWRQADTHINNLYNTTFWALVHSGQTTAEANKTLQGTNSKDKNELLFSQFSINYNNLPEMFRKGSVLVRQAQQPSVLASSKPQTVQQEGSNENHPVEIASQGPKSSEIITTGHEKCLRKEKTYVGTEGRVVVLHEDIVGDAFWKERPWLLL
ncbi:uncharacterized protein L203_104453 [Cryptococcus depauperatus CBS 7841]|uniref:tRNA(His) guanylyltransferase n=1 Tax=Cryptococcus depauperatus CBS 7841 TaxID=1295531 RepID=A0A1E3IG92_9TREE|nr:tRNA(His) guanylyltransferase [Cryptococcus depauperatus CBS 7841]